MIGEEFTQDELERGARAVEVYDLAREIADTVSDFDLTQCAVRVDLGAGDFYDTKMLADPGFWQPAEDVVRARIDRAARYLIAKGRARRHPLYPHIVEMLPVEGPTA